MQGNRNAAGPVSNSPTALDVAVMTCLLAQVRLMVEPTSGFPVAAVPEMVPVCWPESPPPPPQKTMRAATAAAVKHLETGRNVTGRRMGETPDAGEENRTSRHRRKRSLGVQKRQI